MKIISLKQFIITGNFGGVTIGMSKTDLLNLLGKTEDLIDYGNGSGGICYGNYEFFYDLITEKITGIQNDHLLIWPKLKRKNRSEDHKEAIYFENETFKMDLWFLKFGVNLKYTDLIKILKNEAIEFIETYDKHSGCRIDFQSGVKLDFSGFSEEWFINQTVPNKNKLYLNGIRIFD